MSSLSLLTLARQKVDFSGNSSWEIARVKEDPREIHEAISSPPHAFWLYVAVYRFMLSSISLWNFKRIETMYFSSFSRVVRRNTSFSLYWCPYELRLLQQRVYCEIRIERLQSIQDSNVASISLAHSRWRSIFRNDLTWDFSRQRVKERQETHSFKLHVYTSWNFDANFTKHRVYVYFISVGVWLRKIACNVFLSAHIKIPPVSQTFTFPCAKTEDEEGEEEERNVLSLRAHLSETRRRVIDLQAARTDFPWTRADSLLRRLSTTRSDCTGSIGWLTLWLAIICLFANYFFKAPDHGSKVQASAIT